MFQKFLRFFNNPQRNNQRILRHMGGLISKINDLESEYRALSDEALAQKTLEFKGLYAQGETLDGLLVPAFAAVREASRRVLGMRPFDVQLQGGVALHQGMIAEMKTGEGKTLVATLPVYLNALTGKGVHVVTVNDYLAQRDSSVMRPLYEFLGLSVGCIVQDLSHSQRHRAYHSDITYGTNNEFGFDYLKDNMKFGPSEMCQRGFAYAIVDEVDSILIDEARTPLIISGPSEDASHLYDRVNDVILKLQHLHYELDEKTKNVAFTDEGYIEIEKITKDAGLVSGKDLFQHENLMLVHHLNQSLKAHKTFQKNIDYIVKDGQVVLIDEFTGRMMKGRRYSDGLHQAIEAKEHVEIQVENQTLASITFQNFFRMYTKLSGMTGTAETEALEFHDIYKLPVLSIPTNVPAARIDLDDEIFRTFDNKLQIILNQIKECYSRDQPVLVGTLSIEKSEVFADALKKLNIPFYVLNARHHEQEAKIIAQAGAPGAITIATNMAGRGTDIKLGGNLDVMLADALRDIEGEEELAQVEQAIRAKHHKQEEVVRKAGGLFVLGTERNENRRIDNQLRGRSGRQGDPGCSKFFISLEDDLMRIFGPNLKMLDYSLRKTEQSDADPIIHPWLTRSIEKAQQRVEAQHFDTRKHLLKYADVLNAQRTAVYDERHALMHAETVHDRVLEISRSVISNIVQAALDQKKPSDQWNWTRLGEELSHLFGISIDFTDQERASLETVIEKISQVVAEKQEIFEQEWGAEMRMRMEKSLMLKTLDQTWIGHLNAMDHLRSGIHLQAYGQKDPLNEYRHEAFAMFKTMKDQWYRNFLSLYFHANPENVEHYEDDDEGMDALLQKWSFQHASIEQGDSSEDEEDLHTMATRSGDSKQSEDTGYVDYQKILDNLLAQDRKWDKDSFDENDLDDLWGHSKKANSGAKKEAPLDRRAPSKKSAPGQSKSASDAARGKTSKPAADQPRVGRGRPLPGASSSKRASKPESDQMQAPGSRPSVGPKFGRATTLQMKSGTSTGRGSATRSTYAADRDVLSDLGAASEERAGSNTLKRRATSKRGPHIPKNRSDFDIPDMSTERAPAYRESYLSHRGESDRDFNFSDQGQEFAPARPSKKTESSRPPRRRTAVGRGPANRGFPKETFVPEKEMRPLRSGSGYPPFAKDQPGNDPKTRWQSAGSGSQRPGRSASTRPAFDSWKVKDDGGLDLKNQRGAERVGSRGGQKSSVSGSLTQKFYASRAVGGGRSLARSRIGIAQRMEREEASRLGALPVGQSRNPKQNPDRSKDFKENGLRRSADVRIQSKPGRVNPGAASARRISDGSVKRDEDADHSREMQHRGSSNPKVPSSQRTSEFRSTRPGFAESNRGSSGRAASRSSISPPSTGFNDDGKANRKPSSRPSRGFNDDRKASRTSLNRVKSSEGAKVPSKGGRKEWWAKKQAERGIPPYTKPYRP
jgi:preprotein translocase subunit SecA